MKIILPLWAALIASILATPSITAELPNGCANSTPYAAPDWYSDTRVHAHTRLGILDPRLLKERGYDQTPEFTEAEKFISALGAKVHTRHIKTMDEDPWFKVADLPEPAVTSLDQEVRGLKLEFPHGKDRIDQIIKQGRAANLKNILYYWDIGDARVEALHPEFICRNRSGEPDGHKYKGNFLDITGPYQNVVKSRFERLKKMGADGVYLDFRHSPVFACFGTDLEKRFYKLYGKSEISPQNQLVFENWQIFKAANVEETMQNWREVWEDIEKPTRAFIVSTTTVPSLYSTEMRTSLARCGIPKIELETAAAPGLSGHIFERVPNAPPVSKHIRLRFGYALVRDINWGLPPHVWFANFPTSEQAIAATAGIITAGGIANSDYAEERIFSDEPHVGVTPKDGVDAVYKLNKELSDIIDHTYTPYRSSYILFSESYRNSLLGRNQKARHAIFPLYGAAQALEDTGQTFGVLTDVTINELDNFPDLKTMIVPSLSFLSNEAPSVLQKLKQKNVKVIDLEKIEGLAYDETFEQAVATLASEINDTSSDFAVSSDNDISGIHAGVNISFEKRRVTIFLSDDFSWVQTQHVLIPLKETVIASPNKKIDGLTISISKAALERAGIISPKFTLGRLTKAMIEDSGQRIQIDVKHLTQFGWIHISDDS